MNRLIRAILYIVAGCIGVGCAALIIGVVLSKSSAEYQNDDTVNWAKGRARDIAAQAEKTIRNWDYAWGSGNDTAGRNAFLESGTGHGAVSVEADDVQQLNIHLCHGSLTIKEGDSGKIQAGVSKQDEDITVTYDESKLNIMDNRTGSSSRKDVDVYLEIPDGKRFTDISIQIDAGVLETDVLLTSDQMTLNADAGTITADGLEADVFSASVGAGTVDIEDGAFGTVKLDCGVGTIHVEAFISGNADIKCGMGAVDLELKDGADSVNYDLSCGMGSIEIGNHTYTSLTNKKKINNGSSATFDIDCGMGQITIDD